MFSSHRRPAHARRPLPLMLCAGFAVGPACASLAQPADDTASHDRRSSLVQRGPVLPSSGDGAANDRGPSEGVAVFPFEIRPIDGYGANPAHPEWGAAGHAMIRLGAAHYADGIGAPAGADRPSARAISNAVVATSGDTINTRGASSFLWQWGQFLDHDLDETPVSDAGEPFDILVPAGDPWFDPFNTGGVVIALDRSAGDPGSGVREQINNITSLIDASNVYGSDGERAQWLRTNDGTGRLKTSPGDLLPFNTEGLHNAPSSDDPSFFLAGDIRANEQVALAAMHTLFVREHNHWASRIAGDNPGLTGDEIYEHARAIVAAEMQAITYNEFLPLLLGRNAIPPYTGWDEGTDPSISNEFATAAYRVGHTMLNPDLLRADAMGNQSPEGHLSLADAFFTPGEITSHGIDSLLRGLALQPAQAIDSEIVDAVRNFLFGPPGAGGFDLASLNIQRGRDHGLPSYNQLRVAVGLQPIAGFDQLPTDGVTRQRLASVYGSVDDIDPWVGMLAENHRNGALVGETMHRVLRDQFIRLRDGDRFWYQSYLPPTMVQLVERQRLSTIIRRNTGIGEELPNNVFLWQPDCMADTNRDGILSPTDFNAWLEAFNERTFWGDQNRDGFWTPADFNAWIVGFVIGC